jgi:3-hydroxyisobutyrate dehydrogenase-like beta-hydroxyacid dehydrogenase
MNVAVAGLGMIGAGTALALAAAGHDVAGYDPRAEVFERLEGRVRPVSRPSELAAGADVLFVAVLDDSQLRDLLAGADGVFHGDRQPEAIVILSTISMEALRWAAHDAGLRGTSVLDCGVSGGFAVERGELVTMVGGEAEDVEKVRPLLESFSTAIFHMGPVGAGMKTKIARNMFHYVTRVAAYEAVELAGAAGVDPQTFVEAMKACGLRSGPFDLLDRGIGRPGSPAVDEDTRRRSAYFAHKDLDVSFDLGEETGVELPLARLADERYDDALRLTPDV